MNTLREGIDGNGFAIVPGVLDAERVACLLSDLGDVRGRDEGALLQSRGHVYGIRNLIDVWPGAITVAHEVALLEVVTAVLGNGFGVVRSIYFDKPPSRTWSLPWHRDMTIAVRDSQQASGEFHRPTVKAGVPHVEAPAWLLRTMLTARVALDDVTDENGPLLVIPGSHLDVRVDDLPSPQDLTSAAHPVLMCAGDVVLIRPLVVHRSGPSKAGTNRHRRTLHFEFAPSPTLTGGLEWHQFVRGPE